MKTSAPKEAYVKNAAIYRILANAKRLEILNLLKTGEHSVAQLLKIVKIPKANMSQHLALLRHSGVVKTRREGLNIYYTLIEPRIVEPCDILNDLRKKKRIP